MKIRILIVIAGVMLIAACTEHYCPTYGNHYTYSPTKKKSFKAGSKKQVKRAEQ